MRAALIQTRPVSSRLTGLGLSREALRFRDCATRQLLILKLFETLSLEGLVRRSNLFNLEYMVY